MQCTHTVMGQQRYTQSIHKSAEPIIASKFLTGNKLELQYFSYQQSLNARLWPRVLSLLLREPAPRVESTMHAKDLKRTVEATVEPEIDEMYTKLF